MQDWSPDVDLPNYLLKARKYTVHMNNLRTLAPIATAHRYCARKFKRHVIRRERAKQWNKQI